MDRTAVDSSQMKSVGYDPGTQKLHIEFKSKTVDSNGEGPVYEYDNVPPGVHQDFMKAESKGRYFGQTIKGQYPYRRLPSKQTTQEG